VPLPEQVSIDAHGFPVMLAERKPEPPKVEPTPDEVARRRDAVRDAAREYDRPKAQDIKERLRGVTNRPLTADEVDSFTSDVHVQRMDDLVDALDQRHRGSQRGRRTVRIQVPRGHVRRAINELDDDQLRQLSDRLKARGWSQDMVSRHVGGHLTERRKAAFDPASSN
jgi:hypothetical protein